MNSCKRIWKGTTAIVSNELVRKEIWLSFVIAIMCLAVMGAPVSADVSVTLTSITLDPEDSTGNTTNAPGAWSTNTADPLSQVGVMSDGVFLNQGAESGTLGEISIPLEPGITTFTLFGNGIFPENAFYGAVLFFDGVPTPPQVAVYNSNGYLGDFLVQPKNATIIGSANGGLFFDKAPGTSVYIAPDGTKVEVLSFIINSMSSTIDEISFGEIGPDGTFDTTAELILRVTPPPSNLSISTDSFEYSPGDTMTITLDIANPTEESVMFQWYWGVPQFSVWVPVMSASIPAGYDDTHDFSFTLPNWGPTPFGNVFYVQLLDASGEVLDADCECWAYMQLRGAEGEVLDADCECWCKCWAYMQLRGAEGEVLDADCECWAYNPSGEAMPTVDIGEEIKKTIEKIDN